MSDYHPIDVAKQSGRDDETGTFLIDERHNSICVTRKPCPPKIHHSVQKPPLKPLNPPSISQAICLILQEEKQGHSTFLVA